MIFAYVGSGAGEKSHTATYVKMILKEVELRTDIGYELFTPANTHINACKSCASCFYTGRCKLDETDDMKLLKEKILAADFIILGSPVFLHNVSSDTKCFIDRVSYLVKAFALGGKVGMAVSTTSNNGHNTVIDYLEKVMLCLGAYVAAKDNVCIHDPSEFHNDAIMQEKVAKYSDIIASFIAGAAPPENRFLKAYYLKMKEHASISEITGSFHYQFWQDRGFFDFSSYDELMENRLKISCKNA